MSKYQKIYETLVPTDQLAKNDPRRPGIIAEMRAVCRAKTPALAAQIIDWWGWDSVRERNTFVRRARELAK